MTGLEFLYELSNKYYLGDINKKPDYFFELYASYFEQVRERPLQILEMGVYSGASLLIWREYFPNAKIVGLDVKLAPAELEPFRAEGRIRTVQGDQSNLSDLQRCLDLTAEGRFDVIIDDASHLGSLSKASFDFLFVAGLKDQGLYFVEDFGTSYMPPYGGTQYTPPPPSTMQDNIFPSHDGGMIGWLKQLVDEVTLRYYADAAKISRPIASCHFWPNIALVRKLGSLDHLI